MGMGRAADRSRPRLDDQNDIGIGIHNPLSTILKDRRRDGWKTAEDFRLQREEFEEGACLVGAAGCADA